MSRICPKCIFFFAFPFLLFHSAFAQKSKLVFGVRWNYYPDGKVQSCGKEKKGNKEGNWFYYGENGKIAQLEHYKNGNLDGPSHSWWSNGKLKCAAQYKDGLRNGIYTEFDETGITKCRQFFIDGKKNGWNMIYFDGNGLLQEKTFYHLDTIIYRYTYADRDHVIRLFSVESFRNGKLNGTCRYYPYYTRDPRDTSASEVKTYLNGLQDGWERKYFKGKLEEETEYKAGAENGVKRYYSIYEGSLEKVEHYKNGLQDGEYIQYSSNGVILEYAKYKNGRPDSADVFYDSGHEVRMVLWFSAGKPDSSFEFDRWQNGKKFLKEKYYYRGKDYSGTVFDSLGFVVDTGAYEFEPGFKYFRKTGLHTGFYRNKKVNYKREYLTERRSQLTVFYPSGKKMMSADAKYNAMNEPPELFSESGVKLAVGSVAYNKLFYTEAVKYLVIAWEFHPDDFGISVPPGIAAPPVEDVAEVEAVEDDQTAFPLSIPPNGFPINPDPVVKPFFPGGAWTDFIDGQLKYPDAGKKIETGGDVVIRFKIDGDGKLVDFEIVSEVEGHPEFTNEALRVLHLSPRWYPAKDDAGDFVAVPMTVTFHFDSSMALRDMTRPK